MMDIGLFYFPVLIDLSGKLLFLTFKIVFLKLNDLLIPFC